jgi:hypothetical protein
VHKALADAGRNRALPNRPLPVRAALGTQG